MCWTRREECPRAKCQCGSSGKIRREIGNCSLRRTRTARGDASNLLPEGENLRAGQYRLTFDTASYYARQKVDGLYPFVEIIFAVREGEMNFHIPLLLSPYGYTTYRGT